MRSHTEFRQSLPTVKSRQSDNAKRLPESRNCKELDFSSDGATAHQKSRNKQKSPGAQLTRSTASLVFKQSQLQLHSPRRRTRIESAMEQLQKNRKNNQLQSLEFDSEPTYYRLQVTNYILYKNTKKRKILIIAFFRILNRALQKISKCQMFFPKN